MKGLKGIEHLSNCKSGDNACVTGEGVNKAKYV